MACAVHNRQRWGGDQNQRAKLTYHRCDWNAAAGGGVVRVPNKAMGVYMHTGLYEFTCLGARARIHSWQQINPLGGEPKI